ncbi:MAG: hypothetical protein QOC59_179, partial [Microbacteriaceae bacterium]|nr:hypothetical protein [Microbacteriaceae bacterium]
MITLPRPLLVALAVGFSLYHFLLGATTLPQNPQPGRVVAALILYAVATVLSVTVGKTAEMPAWLAGVNVGLSLSMALLVSSTLEPAEDVGYGTWYVAAVGTLLTITAVRRHTGFAWFGVGLLAAQTVLWAGPLSVTRFGVLGDLVWVAIAHVFS